jgi:hypothetical protein
MSEIEREERVERSRPVQARVDVVTLAKLDRYWTMVEGVEIRTLSQLISWSMDLLNNVLEANGHSEEEIDLIEAHRYLGIRGLIQPSLNKRGMKKFGAALTLKSVRDHGGNAKHDSPHQYSMLHRDKKSGVLTPLDGEVKVEGTGYGYGDLIDEAFKRSEEEKLKDLHENTKKAIAAARENGMVVEDWQIDKLEHQAKVAEERSAINAERVLRKGMSKTELDEYNRKREADIIARENAPFDPSEVVTVKELN